MPHFSSSSAGGSPSELIRLWRSRLSTTSDIGKATAGSGDGQRQKKKQRPTTPPPLEPGVLSQQSKMSEAQDVSSIVDSRESSVTEITRQKSEIDEEREDPEDRDASETPKSECASTPRSDEPEKSFVPDSPSGQASAPTQPQQQQPPPPPPQQQQQLQQNRPGECNLLPVLVERLRSALELSCSSQSSEDQLPLEDSGVDSEEDFRLWSTGLSGVSSAAATSDQEAPIKPKLDLKFLEDILLADIHTALARLQDTLKRVDIGTLTRYNASLDPSNKLYLLRLISNLLAKLKVPEEAIARPSPAESRAALRRRRNERHTISVSAEEIARARRWLDEKTPSSDESSPKADLEQESHRPERIVEAAAQVAQENPGLEASMTFSDKCRKDAINQQQSLQNRNGYAAQKENGRTYEQALDSALTAPKRFDGLCKDDSVVDDFQERSSAFYQQHSTAPTRHNKFTAKKTKIKRANTIDIPNYLKLRNEHSEQNGCFALRRPIGVGDKFINGHQKVVPSFEPKTDNDRKFLALINKNTEPANGSPFRSFNYRQTSSVADKNWSNRFSNIKTNFDKPQPNEGEGQRKPGKLDAPNKLENARDDSLEREGMVVGSFKVPYPAPAKQNQNGFTHAPTSPFQKIDKSAPPFFKAGYMPKSGSMLQAKLKMFDQEPSKPVVPNNAEQSRVKNKFVKPLENNFAAAKQQPTGKHAQERKAPTSPTVAENGHLNYYSFCKQFAPFASGKSTEGKSNINTAKSKLLENINKETDKPVIKRNNPKVPFQDRKNSIPKPEIEDNRHDFSKQYSYLKPYNGYPANSYQDSVNHQNYHQNYRQVEKKPEFNDRRASYQEPQRKFEAPTQNVAVQTTSESANRRPSEPELINSIAELSRDCPVPQPRKLKNNASVQTTSPSVASPIQQSYTNTSTPNVNSSVPHTYQNYNPPVVTSAPAGHAAYQPPADPVARSYYNANYSSDQNYQPPINNYSHPSVPYHQPANERKPSLKDIPALSHPVPSPRPAITQKLYNEFSKLPDQSPNRSIDHNKNENTLFPPITISYKDVHAEDDKFKAQAYPYDDKPLPDLIEENIQNQEISSDGVVTRYTCAIATVSPNPESPEPTPEYQSPPLPPQPYEPVVPRIKEPQPRHFAETTSISTSAKSAAEMDEIQRHNMLQQSLIRRMQNEQQQQQQPQYHQPEKIPPRRFSQEIRPKENRSPTSPPFSSANFPGRVCALKALNESHKAQEKINMFEEKKLKNQQLFRPLNVPPKMSIVNPSSVLRNERSPIRNNASPIDSSDEYLMSCASKPNRNIVLSKSESWHQLALAKGAGGLQLPQPSSGAELKPPKPKSPSSLRLSKQFEASSASDNMRKMEEKIQRYFCSPSSSHHSEESSKQTTTTSSGSGSGSGSNRRESKSKRNLQSKKNNLNNLMRSHTMPHLYDERLFDDSVDVDKAFDSIFNEATRSDLRH